MKASEPDPPEVVIFKKALIHEIHASIAKHVAIINSYRTEKKFAGLSIHWILYKVQNTESNLEHYCIQNRILIKDHNQKFLHYMPTESNKSRPFLPWLDVGAHCRISHPWIYRFLKQAINGRLKGALQRIFKMSIKTFTYPSCISTIPNPTYFSTSQPVWIVLSIRRYQYIKYIYRFQFVR